MRPFLWLRMLVFIKRGVVALESIAASQREIAETVVAPTRPPKRPKMASVFVQSVDQMNENWQRQRDVETYGEEISDD